MLASRVALLVFALSAVACGTRRDPDFCCTSAASCAATGTDVGLTACTDPAAPVCDDDGVTAARPRTCIADVGGACSAPGDCTNPDRPYCVDNRCAQCDVDDVANDCTGATPACSPTTHLCGPCGGPADCVGEAGGPVCDTANGGCVECNLAADCTSPDRPVCDAHVCRGCSDDADCASQVCDLDRGACSAPGETLYVQAGAGATDCSMAMPCGTINRAIAVAGTSRRTIRIAAGIYAEAIAVTGAGVDLTFHGVGASTAGTVLDAPAGAAGFSIAGGARAAIESMWITRSLSPDVGIRCTMASLALRRSVVLGHTGGGVDVSACSIELTNDILAANGGPGSTLLVGGLRIQDLSAGDARRVEFLTIVDNQLPSGRFAGVTCSGNVPRVAIRSSILATNSGMTQVSGECDLAWSVVTDATTGTNVTTAQPTFIGGDDYHLAPTSPGRGTAEAPPSIAYDLDGEPRPQTGAQPDPGADEVP